MEKKEITIKTIKLKYGCNSGNFNRNIIHNSEIKAGIFLSFSDPLPRVSIFRYNKFV